MGATEVSQPERFIPDGVRICSRGIAEISCEALDAFEIISSAMTWAKTQMFVLLIGTRFNTRCYRSQQSPMDALNDANDQPKLPDHPPFLAPTDQMQMCRREEEPLLN